MAHVPVDAVELLHSEDVPSTTHKALSEVDASLSASISLWLKRRGKVIRPKLPKDQLQQLTECFGLMDADGSGSIDVDELGAAFKLLGIQMKQWEIAEIVAEVDTQGIGELGIAEFLQIMTHTMHRLATEENGTRQPTVPFGLVATAYRRKRMLEGIMLADKEVRAQLAHLNEKQENEAIRAQTVTEGTPKSLMLKEMSDAKLKAAVFGRRRMKQLGRMNIDGDVISKLPLEDQKLIMSALAQTSKSSLLLPERQQAAENYRSSLASIPAASSTRRSSQEHSNISAHHDLMESPSVFELKFNKSSAVKLPSSNIRAESRSKLRSPSPLSPLPEMQDAATHQYAGTSKQAHRSSAPLSAYKNGAAGASNDEAGYIGLGMLPSISEGTLLGKRSTKDGIIAPHQGNRISPHPLGGSSVASSSSSPLSLKLGSAALSLRSPEPPSNGSSALLPEFPPPQLPGIRQQHPLRSFLPSVHATSPTKSDHTINGML